MSCVSSNICYLCCSDTSACDECDIELAFLVDASTKSNANWQHVLNFVNSYAASFTINQTCVRVAVIRYAASADAPIALISHSSISSLQTHVSLLTVFNVATSNLATALQVLQSQVFPTNVIRAGAKKVAVIIADELTCTAAVTTEATSVRNSGVLIVGVGVTANVNTACLSQVAPSNQYVQAADYAQLASRLGDSVQQACTTDAPDPGAGKYVVHEIYSKLNAFINNRYVSCTSMTN